MYERILNKQVTPCIEEMTVFCGENAERFSLLNEWLVSAFRTEKKTVFPYGNRYGWGIAHKRKNKLICNIFAEDNAFTVMMRLSDRQYKTVYAQLQKYARDYFDETGTVGFFTLRNSEESLDELHFGFVIVNPHKRGNGYGKAMFRLGLKFVFELYGAKKASLGVFENNLPAYYCYKATGFSDVVLDTTEKYCVLGEEWKCKELIMEK